MSPAPAGFIDEKALLESFGNNCLGSTTACFAQEGGIPNELVVIPETLALVSF